MGETSKFERNMFGIRLFVMPRAYMYNVSNSRTTASGKGNRRISGIILLHNSIRDTILVQLESGDAHCWILILCGTGIKPALKYIIRKYEPK